MTKQRTALTILLLYVAFTYLIMFVLDVDTVSQITAEDRYFEYLGAFSLFAASGLFLYAFIQIRREDKLLGLSRLRQFSYLALAALFFFGGGEEISWGQRILGLQTPEALAEINNKDEINLHNLEFFGEKNSLPFRMYQLFSVTFTVIIPLAAMVSASLRHRLERMVHIVPLLFGVVVLTNFLLSQVVSRFTFLGQPGEIQESNYEVTFMCIGIYVAFSVRSMIRERRAGTRSMG